MRWGMVLLSTGIWAGRMESGMAGEPSFTTTIWQSHTPFMLSQADVTALVRSCWTSRSLSGL